MRDDLSYSKGVNRIAILFPPEEDAMNARLVAESEALRRTAERLEKVGLIVDRAALSRAHRRAYFALQCSVFAEDDQGSYQRPKIGFSYPNAR
jgi:hypothetical protein